MAGLRIVVRTTGSWGRLSRFVAGSFALHVVFTLVLVAAPSWRSSPELTDTPLVVDLVSPAVVSPQPVAPPAPAAPPPEPQQAPEGMRAAEQPERIEEIPEPVEPEAEPEPRPPRRDPVPTTPASTTPAQDDATAAPGAIPATESGVVAEGALNDSALAWYRTSVIASLHANWRKPILEGIGQPHEVRVTFEILRDGRVDELRIARSSGVPSLDRSALRAVSDADPLPPPPASWKGRSLPAGFVFRLFPE